MADADQLWVCTSCRFVYPPEDPDGVEVLRELAGIEPGTPFDQLPDTFYCPKCGASKADFEPHEE